MLAFNLAADEAVFDPLAGGYKAVTPKWGRDRVSDFLQNLGEPVTFVNNVLQGDGERALQTAFRFGVNSTLGIGGLFDIAEEEGLPAHDEDFGQTLAVWGVDSGPYLVLPLLGPSNPRDLLGFGVDRAVSPVNYIVYSGNDDVDLQYRVAILTVRGLNARAAADEQVDSLRNQLEPYVALRDVYVRQRNAAIANGKGQEEQDVFQELPEFGDF